MGDTTTVRVGDGVELWAESIGDREHPALLLIGGAAWSMDWWEDDLCGRLVERGRRVVRFDNRDTGRSSSWPPGEPGYTGEDLVTDAIAVLDAFGIGRAHLVGVSMGGGIAQCVALDHGERAATLTLMSASPIAHEGRDLPGMTPALKELFADPPPEPDWGDREAVIAYIVDAERVFAGPGDHDEAHLRRLAGRVFDRSDDIAASMINHWLLGGDGRERPSLGTLAGLPTLVMHGTHDPLFPLEHGRALAELIPGARFVELDGAGHGLAPRRLWDLVVDELTEHTRPA